MESKFQIVPARELVPGEMAERYVLQNSDALLGAAKAYVERHSLPAGIESRDDYRFAKESRKEVSALKKSITKKRLDVNDILMGDYNAKMKAIEKMLGDLDESLKTEIERYDAEEFGKEARKKILTMEVKGYDQPSLKKVEELAVSLGLTVKMK